MASAARFVTAYSVLRALASARFTVSSTGHAHACASCMYSKIHRFLVGPQPGLLAVMIFPNPPARRSAHSASQSGFDPSDAQDIVTQDDNAHLT